MDLTISMEQVSAAKSVQDGASDTALHSWKRASTMSQPVHLGQSEVD